MPRDITVRKLLESITEEYHACGSLDRPIRVPSPLEEAGEHSLSFCSNKNRGRAIEIIKGSKASVIVCPEGIELAEVDYKDKTLIQVSNPRLTFARLVQRFFVPPPGYDIHPSSIIDPGAVIHAKVKIGAYCYLGKCELGEDSVLHGHIHVYPGTKIGKRVIVHPGAVIGLEGFGFERNEDGQLEAFPQLGGVTIENDVQIGANVCIARGTMSDTIIGEGTKIDNLAQISHNDRIGKHCQINALVAIAGSVTIGDYSHIATHAIIREGTRIGHHVLVGMGAVVTRDIEDNLVVMGVPAKPIRKNE